MEKEEVSYYEILGVTRDVTSEGLKKGYYKAALRFHPDKPDGSTEKFQQIQEAFAILSDPYQRQLYDSAFTEVNDKKNYCDEDEDEYKTLRDKFIKMINHPNNFAFRRMTAPVYQSRIKTKGPNKTYTISVTQIPITIKLHRKLICRSKNENENESLTQSQCKNCSNTGVIVKPKCINGIELVLLAPCEHCCGTGEKIISHDSCSVCNRTGFIDSELLIEISVEKAREGKVIIPEACSESHEFQITGDVILLLSVTPELLY